MNRSSISLCSLFKGMNEADITLALETLDASRRDYARGSIIAHSGTKLSRFGLVLSGTVQVSFCDIDGNDVLMASVSAGDTFAESLCWLNIEDIPVTIKAFTDASVLWLSPLRLADGDPSAVVQELRNRFVSMLAKKTLLMNDRVQILSKPTVRLKIITFLSQYSNRLGSKTFSVPFDRETLALYLGVNRSALSRELSAMQNAGIIEFYKNTFKILK